MILLSMMAESSAAVGWSFFAAAEEVVRKFRTATQATLVMLGAAVRLRTRETAANVIVV